MCVERTLTMVAAQPNQSPAALFSSQSPPQTSLSSCLPSGLMELRLQQLQRSLNVDKRCFKELIPIIPAKGRGIGCEDRRGRAG
jgi:hypothetical protein